MRFILHTAALNGNDELFRLIDRLIDRAADEVHRVEVPEVDLLQNSGWYDGARTTRRQVLTSAASAPPRKHVNSHGPHAKQVDVRDIGSARVADKLAHTPLKILVEDRESDGVLLEILVEEVGSPELRELWKRGQEVTPRAIEIANAGGLSSMPQRVIRAVSDATAEGRPVRLIVFCDSDQRWPHDTGHQSYAKITELRQRCEDQAIPLHVLQKRNVENYIPDAVIETVRDAPQNTGNTQLFDALLRRNSIQRDHFPLKDGLCDGERTDALAAGLYDPAEESDLLLLKNRLFPKKPRLLTRLQNERRTDFTRSGLLARDGNGEIDTILKAIALEL